MKMYMGVAVVPMAIKKPFALQVCEFPIPHRACGTDAGAVNGPVIIAKDCNKSEIDRPKMMRWYGEDVNGD